MSFPLSNYLKNTIPELEGEFVELIGEIPIFSNLPKDLRIQLFQYSKFISLRDDQRIITQGVFDQEIFVLLRGALSVLLKDASGKEELSDLMQENFTLLGERSLLGEPRGASIKADGDAFLLGIDLSPLPDMIGAIEDQEKRVSDDEYLRSAQMYTVFSVVLTQRLGRLIRDQYKLKQRILGFQRRQNVWTYNFLLARVFNQFYANELPPSPNIREIIKRNFKRYNIFSPRIREILISQKLSTKKLYVELMKLDTLGKIENLSEMVLTLVNEIADFLKTHPMYEGLFDINLVDVHEELKALSPLSDYLKVLYQSILDSGALSRPMTKTKFLDIFFKKDQLNPTEFVKCLQSEQWVTNNFELAHIMFLVCQQGIYSVSKANNHIRDYVKFLHTYDAPHQDKRSIQEQAPMIVERFREMEVQHNRGLSSEEAPESGEVTQSSVEDLLSSFGL